MAREYAVYDEHGTDAPILYQTEGVPTYQEITSALIPKLNTELYIRSYIVGELAACLSEWVYDRDPSFFTELPPLQEVPEEKKRPSPSMPGTAVSIMTSD